MRDKGRGGQKVEKRHLWTVPYLEVTWHNAHAHIHAWMISTQSSIKNSIKIQEENVGHIIAVNKCYFKHIYICRNSEVAAKYFRM